MQIVTYIQNHEKLCLLNTTLQKHPKPFSLNTANMKPREKWLAGTADTTALYIHNCMRHLPGVMRLTLPLSFIIKYVSHYCQWIDLSQLFRRFREI